MSFATLMQDYVKLQAERNAFQRRVYELEARIRKIVALHREPASAECAICTEEFDDQETMFTCDTIRLLLGEEPNT